MEPEPEAWEWAGPLASNGMRRSGRRTCFIPRMVSQGQGVQGSRRHGSGGPLTAGTPGRFLLLAEQPAEDAAGDIRQAATTLATCPENAAQDAAGAGRSGGLGLNMLVLQHGAEVSRVDALL